MITFKKLTVYWLLFIFLITFTCMLTYVVMQQSLRLGANELPKQYASDAVIQLDDGVSPDTLFSKNKVDISKSPDTFVMVFDDNRNLVFSSATIAGKQISYQNGVLDYVAQKGEDRVTWQTKTGLRFASVAMKYNHGYVVAARSLSFTESLIDTLGKQILIAWVSCLICSAIAVTVIYLFMKKIRNMVYSK